jgi:hypothetical protein
MYENWRCQHEIVLRSLGHPIKSCTLGVETKSSPIGLSVLVLGGFPKGMFQTSDMRTVIKLNL